MPDTLSVFLAGSTMAIPLVEDQVLNRRAEMNRMGRLEPVLSVLYWRVLVLGCGSIF